MEGAATSRPLQLLRAVFRLVVAVSLAVMVAVPAPSTANVNSGGELRTPTGTPAKASTTELRAAVRKQVVFGHQSVGFNIMDGVQLLYRSRGLAPPRVIDWTGTLPRDQVGFIAHAQVGRNTDPESKVRQFEAMLSASTPEPDAALLKFCYVDVTAGTDVKALFAMYRRSVARLEAAHPDTTFLHATVPLTVDDPASNVRRQQYNRLVRSAYRPGRVVDVARIESTTPSGRRVTGSYNGRKYFALYRGYTTDGGHLNPRGASRVASALLQAIARTS